jgi:hypothetical protein
MVITFMALVRAIRRESNRPQSTVSTLHPHEAPSLRDVA